MTRLFAGTEWDQPPRCERCGELESVCECPPLAVAKQLSAPETQTAHLVLERRKRGKLMTVVRGLAAADNDLPALLTRLKTACGAGGTTKDDVLEIQGDHRARVAEVLHEVGYRVRD